VEQIRFLRPIWIGAIAALVCVLVYGAITTEAAQETANQDATKLAQISSPEFDTAVANLATEIQHRKFKAIAVIGAMGHEDQVTDWGPALGDEFRAGLARLASGFRVVDRAELRTLLKRERVSEAMLLSDTLEDWIAGKASADGFVEVKIWSAKDNRAVLTGSLYKRDGVDGELVLVRRATVEMNSDQQSAIARPLNSNWNKYSPAAEDGKPLTNRYNPTCQVCPRPEMTIPLQIYLGDHKELGNKGVELELMVTVLTDGTTDDIAVVKSFRFGINARSVENLRTWKFSPVHDEDGNAIAVRTKVQMFFQTF
jgi:hypothetical protein